MYVSLCSVLPPANWTAYLPNKGKSLLTYVKVIPFSNVLFSVKISLLCFLRKLQKLFLKPIHVLAFSEKEGCLLHLYLASTYFVKKSTTTSKYMLPVLDCGNSPIMSRPRRWLGHPDKIGWRGARGVRCTAFTSSQTWYALQARPTMCRRFGDQNFCLATRSSFPCPAWPNASCSSSRAGRVALPGSTSLTGAPSSYLRYSMLSIRRSFSHFAHNVCDSRLQNSTPTAGLSRKFRRPWRGPKAPASQTCTEGSAFLRRGAFVVCINEYWVAGNVPWSYYPF